MALRALLGQRVGQTVGYLSRAGLGLPVTQSRLASNNARQAGNTESSPLNSFLSSLDNPQPEPPRFRRVVRKSHMDVASQAPRSTSSPINRNTTERAAMDEEITKLQGKIEQCENDPRAARKIVEDIKALGEQHGESPSYWKLWTQFAEKFPAAHLDLAQLGVSSTQNRSLVEEFRYLERSAFVSEVIELFSHVRGPSTEPGMPKVKNVDKNIFYTLPVHDPHHGVRKEDTESNMLLHYENRSKANNPDCFTKLGDYYVTSFPDIARWWYRKADEAAYPPGKFRRAVCYEFGFVVEKQDLNTAIRLYKEAAAGGYTPAMNNLAAIIRESDPEGAFELFLAAAQRGHADSLCNLGLAFLRGQGTSQDAANGIRLLNCAAEYQHPTANYHLGSCAAMGVGMQANQSLAARYWGLGARLGCLESAYSLGMCFLKGHSLPQNDAAAFRWFSEAAKSQHPFALYYQGTCLRHGRGVEKNEQEALKSFVLASDRARFLNDEMRKQLTSFLEAEEIQVAPSPSA